MMLTQNIMIQNMLLYEEHRWRLEKDYINIKWINNGRMLQY